MFALVKAGSRKLPMADLRPKFSLFAHSIVLSNVNEELAIQTFLNNFLDWSWPLIPTYPL
jgi:hypothetical protein